MFYQLTCSEAQLSDEDMQFMDVAQDTSGHEIREYKKIARRDGERIVIYESWNSYITFLSKRIGKITGIFEHDGTCYARLAEFTSTPNNVYGLLCFNVNSLRAEGQYNGR